MHTRLAVIEGPYLHDILEQPAATQRTVDMLTADTVTANALLGLTYDRVVLTGMGSSYHALHPLNIRLNRAGIHSQMVETSELVSYYPETLGERTLTVAVSQSGESAETVRLLRDGLSSGPLVGVTNSAGSTLASASDIALITDAGPEATVSCKTYLATLQALHWLGSILLKEDLASSETDLRKAQQGVAQYLGDWQAHTDWFLDQWTDVRQLFITGRGWSMATAGTGGLILKESVRCCAEGMSSAAFRHGPLEMLSKHILTCICLGDQRTAALNRRLHADVKQAGGQSCLLAPDSPQPALRLPDCVPELLPMLEILPVQMISLACGAYLGLEAGRFSLASKITSIE